MGGSRASGRDRHVGCRVWALIGECARTKEKDAHAKWEKLMRRTEGKSCDPSSLS